MKTYLKILLLLLFPLMVYAQQSYSDSLKLALKMATTDSAKFSISHDLFTHYTNDNIDSALSYIGQALLIARKNNRKINEADCLQNIGMLLPELGKYSESLEAFQEAFKIAEDPANESLVWKDDSKYSLRQIRLMKLGWTHLHFGTSGGYTNNTDQEMFHIRKAIQLGEEIGGDNLLASLANLGMAGIFMSLNKLDSALLIYKKFEQVFQGTGTGYYEKKYLGDVYHNEGSIYASKGEKEKALYYYHKALDALTANGQNNLTGLSGVYWDLANYFLQEKQKDSSLYYAKKTVEDLNLFKANYISWGYLTLSKSYELENNIDSAYKYQRLAFAGIDSNYRGEIKNKSEFQKQLFKNQMRVKELDQEKISFRNKIRTNILLGGLFIVLVVAFILFRNNRQKQKANRLIAQQKEQVESALSELKSTQSQLIQSEKMASLGELTAGIAHEIQNPLNFVNNFSEVSTELLEEMKEELATGNTQQVNEIANDVKQNLEKIIHHGKRADAIVKGMLQHSRTSSATKEPTDINALCDEYIRLAYHGLRAKDKSFNANFKTNFDESVGKINIIPQEIGRVILNLLNNAFYAVSKKQHAKRLSAEQAGLMQNAENYEPLVTISTKKQDHRILIRVDDNGNGIPASVKDKIFQPFFTTKPTGQGTGLGLSISYDIITKAHNGKLKLETKEDEGASFIILLPVI
ncbi:MAG: tetratricopeptide repeat protein [Sphingobacteriales bacterium]|nr:tetratricopeptide repeat protein [Sphingobacteriales bacterium]MBI3720098.1 tetratricopeptide repeat protein [Sphingobacteriales bacterium]